MLILFLCTFRSYVRGQDFLQAPPNEPAIVQIEGRVLTVRYDGSVILTGTLSHDPSEYYFREIKEVVNGAVHHTFSLTSTNGNEIRFNGNITASGQSFPCEENRNTGSTFIRHSSGLSHSLLNRAVYDRKRDWVLAAEQAAVVIQPGNSTGSVHVFEINITGKEICILFKPLYYQKHRGLSRYEPWTYDVWKEPVVGWCSWYAYFNKVTEADMKATADVLAETLGPFGLGYVQIDDGYQQECAFPEKWIRPNGKFPGGMDGLASYISGKGLKPGIWTNVAFTNKDFVDSHPSWFVTDPAGVPVNGRWIGYVLDGSEKPAVDSIIRPVYQYFRETGWKYYKLDALRHLRYEGYNSNTEYFSKKQADREEAFRNVVKAVRSEIGEENFLLACWGIRPELIGIVDGCRIGDDGFGLRTLTQYNSFNNVVWRNDPDHIELGEGVAYSSCMVTSMTGSLFMLTDKAPVYRTPVIEAARRSIPVLFTMPGQLYDIDPSCSMYLDRVGSQLSGSGPRIFDARYTSPYTHFLLEINKPYESWMLLGRTDGSRDAFTFAEMGLDPQKEYLVFEFWTKKFLGSFSKNFRPGRIDTSFNCQLLCIREVLNHPQLIATSRHISCGGFELEDLHWHENSLSGRSRVVANDEYAIYIREKAGFRFRDFGCTGGRLVSNLTDGEMRIIRVISPADGTLEWEVMYE